MRNTRGKASGARPAPRPSTGRARRSSKSEAGHGLRSAKREGGFTLLELLVAMTILAIMSTALFTVFDQSTRTWQKADVRTRQFVAAREALGLMAMELRQAIVRPKAMGNRSGGEAYGAHFRGYPDGDVGLGDDYEEGNSYQDELYFVTPTEMRTEKAKQDICLIGYWVNEDRELMRYCLADRNKNDNSEPDWYTLSFPTNQNELQDRSDRLGINVHSLTFEFWARNDDEWDFAERDRHEWFSDSSSAPPEQRDTLPSAIRIKLVVWDPTLEPNADPDDPEVRKRFKTFITIVRLNNAR